MKIVLYVLYSPLRGFLSHVRYMNYNLQYVLLLTFTVMNILCTYCWFWPVNYYWNCKHMHVYSCSICLRIVIFSEILTCHKAVVSAWVVICPSILFGVLSQCFWIMFKNKQWFRYACVHMCISQTFVRNFAEIFI